mgnify:CR=1 FL=1
MHARQKIFASLGNETYHLVVVSVFARLGTAELRLVQHFWKTSLSSS